MISPTDLIDSMLNLPSAVQLSENFINVDFSWVRRVFKAEMVVAEFFNWFLPSKLRGSWVVKES